MYGVGNPGHAAHDIDVVLGQGRDELTLCRVPSLSWAALSMPTFHAAMTVRSMMNAIRATAAPTIVMMLRPRFRRMFRAATLARFTTGTLVEPPNDGGPLGRMGIVGHHQDRLLKSWLSFSSRARISSALFRSRSPVGSSATMMVGSSRWPSRWRHVAPARRRAAAGNGPRGLSSLTTRRAVSRRFCRSASVEARQQQRKLDVLEGREHRHQVVRLEDEAHGPRAKPCELASLMRAKSSPATSCEPVLGGRGPR